MATLSANYVTALDVAKMSGADKSILDVIEILAAMSPVFKLGYTQVCNDGSRNITTQRASIPSPTWVQYYSRITPVKSTTRQVTDTTGMAEALVDIDSRLYDRTKDKDKLRMLQALGVIEGFAQEVETTFFYGDTGTTPLEFLGLAPRMNSLSADNARQIVDGGGTGSDNTSIFFNTWGPRCGYLLTPEGVPAGVRRENKGRQRSETTAGVLYFMEELFKLDLGFAMEDWRYFVRICNIDVSNLSTGSAADLYDLLTTAYYRLPSRRSTTGFSQSGEPVKIKPVIYCNSTILEHLDKQAKTAPNRYLMSKEDVFGDEVLHFRGFPIYETDGIVNTETRVT